MNVPAILEPGVPHTVSLVHVAEGSRPFELILERWNTASARIGRIFLGILSCVADARAPSSAGRRAHGPV